MLNGDLLDLDKWKVQLQTTENLIAKWRKVLRIDPKWSVTVSVVRSDSTDDSDTLAAIDLNNGEYFNAVFEIHEKLSDKCFDEEIEGCVVHELLHLLMWQYSSFCSNMLDSEQAGNELSKLEEQVVKQLEVILLALHLDDYGPPIDGNV